MSKLRVNTLETIDGSYAVNVADLSLATTVVEDNLTSTNVASALSANQGRVLKGLVDGKQATLVSGTNLKTVNSTSLLGSGDVAVQATLVSGSNIKTVNSTSLLGSGNVAVQPTLVSGTNIKTVNSTSLLGSGNVAVGDVTGVSSSTAQQLAVASGTTGKGIKFVPVQIDDNGNVTVVGTGLRFQADFSNATTANRLTFQTSTTNGNTNLHVVPNGTATTCGIKCESDSAVANSSYVGLDVVGGSRVQFISSARGSGTFLPFEFWTNDVSRVVYEVAGAVRPGADNTQTLGSASYRWSTVYAGTGTINTSDARAKTPVRGMTDAEIAAAKDLSKEIGVYQFLQSVIDKGTDARQHIGLTVQRAAEIMTGHGLDPWSYGFMCHDTWADQYGAAECQDGDEGAVKSETFRSGWERQSVVRPAGDAYSFRYDQLVLFIARGLEARIAALEAA